MTARVSRADEGGARSPGSGAQGFVRALSFGRMSDTPRRPSLQGSRGRRDLRRASLRQGVAMTEMRAMRPDRTYRARGALALVVVLAAMLGFGAQPSRASDPAG